MNALEKTNNPKNLLQQSTRYNQRIKINLVKLKLNKIEHEDFVKKTKLSKDPLKNAEGKIE